MSKIICVRGLALVSLLTVPACVDEAAELSTAPGAAETALTASVCPSGTPASLAPAIDQDLAFALDATGVQKYACKATATGAAWTFVAPEATLFDSGGNPVCSHFAGPTWEYEDGSSVVGAKIAGATLDPSAIPWLLLSTPSHGGPNGKMTGVTAIQRLSTTGGLAPATGCDADHLGATADVPYTAKYFFYRTHSSHPEKNIRCGAK